MIYSKNLNKYKKYVKMIFNKLLIKRLRYNSEKYKFYKIEINFWIFYQSESIKIDLIKAKTIKE